jgi:serine/threonine protein kinase
MSDSQANGRNVNAGSETDAGSGSRAAEPSRPVQSPLHLTTEQPTVISNRPPISVPGFSDSVYRIMEGRIMPGDHLGHFELVEYIGGGGMGRVFRATDTRLARTVALKILPPEQAADPETLQRFQNEAQSAARLDHENIARVHYVGEDRGLNFIAFEFVEGENVRKLLERKGPLPLGEAVSYTLQVAEALAHADARHVVHRDIKPSNVLITPSGRVKLIDMGLARLRHADPAGVELTASGVTLGTFDYIAPEQARDPRNADIRSDIYSLGCTFFYMLTGRPPFPEGTVLQKLLQHQAEPPPDVRQLRPDLPEEANRILQKMMAKDPQRRYGEPGELVADLMFLAEQLGLRPVSPSSTVWLPVSPPKVSFFPRHLPWIASVAALVCIVIGLDIFWKFSSPAEPPQSALLFGPEEFVPELPAPNHNGSKAQSADTEIIKSSPTNSEPSSEKPAGVASPAPVPAAETSAASKPGQGLSGPLNNPPPETKNVTAPGESSTIAPQASAKPLDVGGETSNARFGFDSSQSGISLDYGDYYAISLGPTPGVRPESLRKAAGATSAPAAAGENLPPAENVAKQNNLLVVSNLAAGENQYTTLAAACAAARNGDIIELRYTGRREERPIRMANLRVTIRAGEGYQPVIIFRPQESDPVKYPRSMFTLTSGRLNIFNLAFEFSVPREIPADNWSLMEIRGGQAVRLEKCSLTVDNASDQLGAYHQDVACFRASTALGADAAVAAANHTAPPLAAIELVDSVVRGEAVFLAVEDLQPVHLAWDNGMLMTTEHLLSASGGAQSPKPDEMLLIDLRHVTVVARNGLARLASTQAAPYQFTVQFNCIDNIIMTLPEKPLIEQEVIGPLENARRQIVWNGDHNFYQDTKAFWTIRSLDAQPASDTLNFEGWRKYWGASRENQPFYGHIAWNNLPGPEKPLHLQTPADYGLSATAVENPALGAASDGRNAGVQFENLLPLPLDAAAEKLP